MWNQLNGEGIPIDNQSSPNFCTQNDPQDNTWFKSICNTVRRYKNELFGESDSRTYIRRQRTLDYTIPPNYKFVFARHEDGVYRPASIMGRNKKMQLLALYFYHNTKCCYVKPRDIIIRHGNLLDRKVCFCLSNHILAGRVYGNNSPANHGFPSLFYIRKRGRWFKIPFEHIFLTRKQLNRMYFQASSKRRSSNCVNSKSSIGTDKTK